MYKVARILSKEIVAGTLQLKNPLKQLQADVFTQRSKAQNELFRLKPLEAEDFSIKL